MLSPGVFHTVGQSSEVLTCHLPPSAFVLSLLEGRLSNNIFNWQDEEKGIGLAHRLTKLSDSFGNNESSLRTSHDCLSLGLKMTCAQTNASILQKPQALRARDTDDFPFHKMWSLWCWLLLTSWRDSGHLVVIYLLSIPYMARHHSEVCRYNSEYTVLLFIGLLMREDRQ